MGAIAILLGLKSRPPCEPCFAEERALKREKLERLLAEIAERRGSRSLESRR